MLNDTETLELLKKKADAYLVLGTKIHIKYKTGQWVNGIITDVKNDFFMLTEVLKGPMPIFFLEVEDIDKYTERREERYSE